MMPRPLRGMRHAAGATTCAEIGYARALACGSVADRARALANRDEARRAEAELRRALLHRGMHPDDITAAAEYGRCEAARSA